MKNQRMYSPAWDEFLPRATWAYTGPKKKNGTNTIDINPRMIVSVANARSRKICSRSSGCLMLSSKRTNTAISARPTTMHAQVATLPQPHTLDCSKPSTVRAMPPVINAVPR